MKKNLLFFLLGILTCLPGKIFSQTYQLTGNPVNTTGWDIVPAAVVNGDFIQLTPDQTTKIGGIKLNETINLKSCDNWQVEFDFRMDGAGTYAHGDGIAFWYLANPPATYVTGSGLGIPDNAEGLMVAFDTYNNSNDREMSKVHVLYGTNSGNIEFNNTPGSTFHSADLKSTLHFVGPNYRHVKVSANIDPAIPDNWIIKIEIDNTLIVNQSFAPSGGALNMSHGYFGFSSSTGAATARQSIKDVKVYADKLPLLKANLSPDVCINSATGVGSIDLTALNSQFINNPGLYNFTYFVSGSGTPIANPSNFQYTGNTTIHVFVKDPGSTLCDGNAIIQLTPVPFTTNNVTLTGCNNNNAGTATFDLTAANLTTFPGVTKQYYPSLYDLNAGTNEILNPSAYPAPEGIIYVKITTPQGCISISEISIKHYPTISVTDTSIESCFIEDTPSMASFNLSGVVVTSQPFIEKKYYPSLADAINGTNEITTPAAYIAPNGVAYIKVVNSDGCFAIAKVDLTVTPPVYSTILKDKIICMTSKTTLDAGPGFKSYEWSTGATTPSIKDVGVGKYWVKLKKRDCTTLQMVTIYPAEEPVISSIDISGESVTVHVIGGMPPYQYSTDNITWQDSNTFNSLPRGVAKVYIKDRYNCEPIIINITIPNLVNIITPNDDGINDFIDYSALAVKPNFAVDIYDRYGIQVFKADKANGYRWNGTTNGRRVPTGSYWYSVSWNEKNNMNNIIPINFAGWIIVKNRN